MQRHPFRTIVYMTLTGTLVFATGVGSAVAKTNPSPSDAPTTPPQTGLQANWNSIVANSPSLANATLSAYAFDVTKGQVLASIHPDWNQTPASVTKLVTSGAALAAYGPNYRYATQVQVPARSSSGATSSGAKGTGTGASSKSAVASTPLSVGPIYLVGGGDPLLEANNAPDLEALAKQVASKVRRATQVIGVGSLFAPPAYPPGWPLGDLPYSYGTPSSALMAEESQIEVMVTGTRAGSRPSVQLIFSGGPAKAPEFFHIVNQGMTVKAGDITNLVITRQLGTENLVVKGNIAPGATHASFLSVGDGALFAATLFQDLLKKEGVQFTAGPSTGSSPVGKTTTLATHWSDTLTKDIKTQNQYSVNPMAENLFRMLGVKTTGVGSFATANAARVTFLQKAGVQTSGMNLYDGSGLSPLDQMNAKQMVQFLTYAARQPWFNVFQQSLMKVNDPANAGVLRYHPFQLPQGTSIWVKTGNLVNQWNYAGYARAENGDLVAFAILDDGAPTQLNSRGGALDEMMVDVARWPNEPRAAAVPLGNNNGGQEDITLAINSAPIPIRSLLRNAFPITAGTTILGVSAVDVRTGKPVWNMNGQKLLRAGVLPRLVLAETALKSGTIGLGNTTVQAVGAVKNGTLNGSLLLTGDGQAALGAGDFTQLAKQVLSAGIHAITGPVQYLDVTPAETWMDAVSWDNPGKWWMPSVQGNLTVSVQPNPGQLAANSLRDALQQAGVTVPAQVQWLAQAPSKSSAVATLPNMTIDQALTGLLFSPSNATANVLFGRLGAKRDEQVQQEVGSDAQIQDITGMGLENYVTPESVAESLARAWNRKSAAGLTQILSKSAWVVDAPEVRTVAGYVADSNGTKYAVVAIQTGLPWNGSFTPVIQGAPSMSK